MATITEQVQELTPETHATVERLAEDLDRTLAALKKAEQKLNQQLQASAPSDVLWPRPGASPLAAAQPPPPLPRCRAR